MELKAPAKMLARIANIFGFKKTYNTTLFFLCGGIMLIFGLVRLPYLNIAGNGGSSFKNGAVPGEWYVYRKGYARVGITIHLWTALPCALLIVWQFVPNIRHQFLRFHRVNGYIVILLTLISNAGALMICRKSMNGGLETQTAVMLLVCLSTVAIAIAYYNIKRLQIDQHRAWMLRTAFYLGTIITTRVIMVIAAATISGIGRYYQPQSCDKIGFTMNASHEQVGVYYPECAASEASPGTMVAVLAKLGGRKEQTGAALSISFGMALWFAIFIHVTCVEIYLALTPAEAERLRAVSYEKQLNAGLELAGSAGLTFNYWRDLPTKVPVQLS